MVVGHFVDPTHAAYVDFEDAGADVFRRDRSRLRGRALLADGTAAPAEKRRDHFPGGSVLGRKLHFVQRKSDERTVQNERLEPASIFKATSNAGFGSFGCDVTRSCSRFQSLKIRIFSVIGADPLDHGRCEEGPTITGYRDF